MRPAGLIVASFVLLAQATVARASALVAGFRGDGSGVFDAAGAPDEWGPSKHVVFRVALPSWSNASPVVVGDRVCVVSEPTTVSCHRTSDGKPLWSRAVTRLDALAGPERKVMEARLAAVPERRKALERGRSELVAARRAVRRGKKGVADPEKLQADVNVLTAELDALFPFEMPPQPDIIGWGASTPASDGRALYVAFRNGVAAKLLLDGSLAWATYVGEPIANMGGAVHGHASSPRLAGDVVVVGLGVLAGLDAGSGAVRWRGARWSVVGTPTIIEADGRALVLSPDGSVVDARDGKVWAQDPTYDLAYTGPLVSGGVWFVIGSGPDPKLQRDGHGSAFALDVRTDSRGISLVPRWSSKGLEGLPDGRYYASPVHDGTSIHAVTERGVLSTLSAKTGERTSRLDVGGFGRAPAEAPGEGLGCPYPSLAVADGKLHVFGEGGAAYVFTAAPVPVFLRKNRLPDEMRASPVFVGRRLYLRTKQALWAIEEP